MEVSRPVKGEIYQHFKGGIYQIQGIAKDSETEAEMVVYQSMIPPYQAWVRSVEAFMEKTDLQKYPEATQEYRFRKIDFTSLLQKKTYSQEEPQDNGQMQTSLYGKVEEKSGQGKEEVSEEELHDILLQGQAKKQLSQRMTEQEIAQRGMLQILDAASYEERRQLLVGLRPYLDKLQLHNIAAAWDVVLEEGPIEEQFESLLQCVKTCAKYEGGRLR